MNKLFFAFFILYFSIQSAFGLGSLITNRNSYFYAEPDLQSKKYYVPTYSSFKVLDIFVDSDNQVFFLVEKNTIHKKERGVGFVYVNLEETEEKIVKFFKEIPIKQDDFLQYHDVSVKDLKATGKRSPAKGVPFLFWYEVNYNIDFPEKIWASNRRVSYRPNKSSKWLDTKNQQITNTRLLPRLIRDNILAGLVEIGYTPEQVILALEEPLEQNLVNDTKEWNYEYRKIIFRNNKVFQIIVLENK